MSVRRVLRAPVARRSAAATCQQAFCSIAPLPATAQADLHNCPPPTSAQRATIKLTAPATEAITHTATCVLLCECWKVRRRCSAQKWRPRSFSSGGGSLRVTPELFDLAEPQEALSLLLFSQQLEGASDLSIRERDPIQFERTKVAGRQSARRWSSPTNQRHLSCARSSLLPYWPPPPPQSHSDTRHLTCRLQIDQKGS